jgi:hypothetical protein
VITVALRATRVATGKDIVADNAVIVAESVCKNPLVESRAISKILQYEHFTERRAASVLASDEIRTVS